MTLASVTSALTLCEKRNHTHEADSVLGGISVPEHNVLSPWCTYMYYLVSIVPPSYLPRHIDLCFVFSRSRFWAWTGLFCLFFGHAVNNQPFCPAKLSNSGISHVLKPLVLSFRSVLYMVHMFVCVHSTNSSIVMPSYI